MFFRFVLLYCVLWQALLLHDDLALVLDLASLLLTH